MNNTHVKYGDTRDVFNSKINVGIMLYDDVFLGSKHHHNWTCLKGHIIEGRSWNNIRSNFHKYNNIRCYKCEYEKQEQRYMEEVEKGGEYEYIRSYRKGDILPNGKTVKHVSYLQVKHKYCSSVYEVSSHGFINCNNQCPKCCGSYEKSFAYHIEQELGEPLEKYWDFEKNTVNPYHIWKSSGLKLIGKIWIKCQEKDYHGSYQTACNKFIQGDRCSYCASKLLHPIDSFGQYLIDNNAYHLWSNKNTIDPFLISRCSNNLVYMLCSEKDYHNDYGGYPIYCGAFTGGSSCGYCHPSGKNPKVHPYDSFGYHNFDKAQSWHPDNKISPFRTSRYSNKDYKFLCHDCGLVYNRSLYSANYFDCPECSMSKGEKNISSWLRFNNVTYEYEKTYPKLKGLGGGKLSYDFYLPEYNVLIEYQGEFHDGKAAMQTTCRLEYQQEHDRRKKEYAERNNIRLIEIWYYDFNKIEDILEEEINLKL